MFGQEFYSECLMNKTLLARKRKQKKAKNFNPLSFSCKQKQVYNANKLKTSPFDDDRLGRTLARSVFFY